MLAIVCPRAARSQVRYDVHQETRIHLSPHSTIEGVRIWHALPGGRERGRWLPEDGFFYRHSDPEADCVYWERSSRALEGLSFNSQFWIQSNTRVLPNEATLLDWESIDPALSLACPRELVEEARQVRARLAPAEALQEFARWVRSRLTYVAVAPHAQRDLEATLREGKGHCGHYAEVYVMLCRLVGLRARTVVGLNLYTPDGLGGGPFPNIHCWAQVELPGYGDIEVDPYRGDDALRVPPLLIENNRWFQNYAVWVKQQGQWRPHRWHYREGQLTSEIGLEHRITYRLRQPEGRRWFRRELSLY